MFTLFSSQFKKTSWPWNAFSPIVCLLNFMTNKHLSYRQMGTLFTKPLKVGPIKHKPHNEIVTMLSTGEVVISKTASGGHFS